MNSRTYRSYLAFSSLVLEDRIYLHDRMSFSVICSLFSLPARRIDRVMRRELGMGAEEYLDFLRRRESDEAGTSEM